MDRLPRNTPALRLSRPTARLLGAVAVAMLLTACASSPTHPGARPAGASASASTSASTSTVVYPAPGRAAIENDPLCRLAHNAAVPSAKRRRLAADCDRLLQYATDPVTKPVTPTESPTSPSPVTGPPAKDCAADDVEARFLGGGLGTGSDFGEIVIWNPGPEPCQLHGRVGFAGFYADGSRDSAAMTVRPTTIGRIILPSNMTRPKGGQEQSRYLVVFVMGPERDDPTQPDGLCQDEGTPSSLAVSIGSVTIRTANNDPGSTQVTGIYGCHGRVYLESLRSPRHG